MPEQLDFAGRAVPMGSVSDKIASILRRHSDARNDYHALIYWYWVECDGLVGILEEIAETGSTAAFYAWLVGEATSTKTIQNRAMEIQRKYPELDARPEVRKWRDDQATAGPVGDH